MYINTDYLNCINSYTRKPTGFADVINKGGYVATFAIGYYFKNKYFAFDSPKLLYNQSYRIAIPADATSISFLARLYLTSSETRVICRKNYPTSFRKYFELRGTIIKSSCSEIG
ncbi:hypothetical protein [Clostridium botulinum]|uniref:Uncharacterized protein n=1 Tax=Clostridium botulinum TaxID=1491 RepID=A0A9Q1UW59_CLOBO|nr:hypothetical protein [Clostridium botulinum]AEB77567.1 hypothetical protein CbC4_6042 [Clostridium botulinum BKT015925]KEH95962.1 hypothetical protein Y848_p0138 [Clostridium botulinum C/D str. Sp77]KLU74558.1 hypothetical protein CBC3_13565 [Clostridium botulinum V891]KOA78051.1 hypothetical protein ADU77_06700 [Clostridium botulinum]KOA83019.1 hypothetical protein ADU80_12970 [Clostridium botulinum]